MALGKDYVNFLVAIRAQPHDDLPRLVCADWLEDKDSNDGSGTQKKMHQRF